MDADTKDTSTRMVKCTVRASKADRTDGDTKDSTRTANFMVKALKPGQTEKAMIGEPYQVLAIFLNDVHVILGVLRAHACQNPNIKHEWPSSLGASSKAK